MMPSPTATAIFILIAAVCDEVLGISVPTGKQTPITPAKVTPRPTYHPPSANPAPVHEYTFDSPEPAPLDPSWVPVPVKYLHVLRANSVLYVPVRIPNPAAQQPNYYNLAMKEQPSQETTEATTYQKQQEAMVYQTQQPNTDAYQTQAPNNAVYQTQKPNIAVYQTQQPNTAVYQTQQPNTAVYQTQQPNTAVFQAQQQNTAVFQAQQQNTAVYQNQQASAPVYENQETNASVYPNQQQNTATIQSQQPTVQYQKPVYPKETDNTIYQKDGEQVQEFGAKISTKKYKPYYYLPKSQYKQATKAGYPKKAVAAPSQKYYFYYPIPANSQ